MERVYTRDLKPLQFKVRILDEAFSYNSYYGIVAPTVERVPEEDGVVGSNPTDSTFSGRRLMDKPMGYEPIIKSSTLFDWT